MMICTQIKTHLTAFIHLFILYAYALPKKINTNKILPKYSYSSYQVKMPVILYIGSYDFSDLENGFMEYRKKKDWFYKAECHGICPILNE